jgi:choline dehydrogenase-like flavoprotein
LTEDPDVTVALIEAGGRDTAPEIGLPIAFPQLFTTEFDWDFATEPEPALKGRRVDLPRGKGLGGCSSINAMVYIRGNRADFDDWSRRGAAGWSFEKMLPYFIKSEANEIHKDALHGTAGPLTVGNNRSMHPLVERFVRAGVEAGLARNDDFNGKSQFGVGRYQMTQRNGARWSAAQAYLHPASNRSNLQVFTNALVRGIEFDGKHARRVLVSQYGEELTLLAEREIIVSAGAYGSPQLLMLSGIGPADSLGAFGIKPMVDLPVGENLQDHPFVLLNYFTDQPTLMTAASEENFRLFGEWQRGPLTGNLAEGGGFFASRAGLDAPDLQLTMGPAMFADEGLTAPYDHGYGFGPSLLTPTSRGKVTLRSPRPDAKPRIFCNMLTTPEDKAAMIAGVRTCLKIARQPSLVEIQRAVQNEPASDRDADIWDYIQQHAGVIYHPTSTCSMGRVVDCLLNVQGVHGLRVVDASVMPSVVRGNTNAAVIAIAEKAADIMTGRATR